MKVAPIPGNEPARLEKLRQYRILDTAAEKVFDDITRLAAEVCGAPISLITFIDAERQWIKAKVGIHVSETRREVAFCAHAILQPDLFVVPDATRDERFADNPLVTGEPRIRFYAGMPLVTADGHAVGSLCVIDRVPRELSEEQRAKLKVLAQGAVMLLEQRLPAGA